VSDQSASINARDQSPEEGGEMVRSMVWRSAAVVPLDAIAAVSTRSLLVLAALTTLVVLVVVGAVVSPAIWSRRKHRRDAALAVLERIFGWRSSALPPPVRRARK
jgi:hypothetical protein